MIQFHYWELRNLLMPKNLETILLLSLGAILGANLRYWLGGWVAQRWGTLFPIHTLIINLTGSLLLAFFMTLAADRFLIDVRWRVFFAVGFLGSYTTFSTYTFESMALLASGNWLLGLANLAGSMLLGILAAGLGVLIGRML